MSEVIEAKPEAIEAKPEVIEAKPRDLYVNYNQVMKYLADNNIKNAFWITGIAKGTGFNVIATTEDMKPTKVTLEEVLKMEWFRGSDLKPVFKALNIEIEYSKTKFYDFSDSIKRKLSEFKLDLHWSNVLSDSELNAKFRYLTINKDWENIITELNEHLPVYNKWASDKTLIYTHGSVDQIKFQNIILPKWINNRLDYPNLCKDIADYILNGGKYENIVFGACYGNINTIYKDFTQIIIDECKMHREKNNKLAQLLKQ